MRVSPGRDFVKEEGRTIAFRRGPSGKGTGVCAPFADGARARAWRTRSVDHGRQGARERSGMPDAAFYRIRTASACMKRTMRSMPWPHRRPVSNLDQAVCRAVDVVRRWWMFKEQEGRIAVRIREDEAGRKAAARFVRRRRPLRVSPAAGARVSPRTALFAGRCASRNAPLPGPA